jgi:lysophospholipase L1-like esterase
VVVVMADVLREVGDAGADGADLELADPYCLAPAEEDGLLRGAPWRRVVVLGDSVAEGLGDPVPGYRSRSWARRLRAALDRAGLDRAGPDRAGIGVEFRNLGRRGLRAGEVRAGQLDAALEFRPDLALVVAGANDAFGAEFDQDAVAAELAAMVAALRGAGAAVVLSGLFDFGRSGLLPAEAAAVVVERVPLLCKVTEQVAVEHGGWFVDLVTHPASGDPGIYSADRLHCNARGHAIAAAETVRTLSRALPGAR